MLSLIAKITIAGRVFPSVGSVKITTSIDDYMDTATIIVPKGERHRIKENDEVSIELGYESTGLNVEFYGKVREISPASPYEIRCTDLFYELKQVSNIRNFVGVPIAKTVRSILKGTGIDPNISLMAESRKATLLMHNWDGFKAINMTARRAIQKLATDNGFFAFFDGKKMQFLHRGTEAIIPWKKFPLYEEGINIIENSLKYHEGYTVKSVKVTSEHKSGSRIYAIYREPKVKIGPEKSVFIDGLSDGQACWNRAKELADELNAPGYTGDIKTFGYPYVRAGQFCGIQMRAEKFPTIQVVKKTEVSFDQGGFKRIVVPSSCATDVYNINIISRLLRSFNYFGISAPRNA